MTGQVVWVDLKGSSRASSTAPTRGRRPVGALDVTHAGIDTVDSEDDETQDDVHLSHLSILRRGPRRVGRVSE